MVFGVGMLRKQGPKEWVATEVRDVNAMNFRFINKSEPSDYAVRVAEAMHLYPKYVLCLHHIAVWLLFTCLY